jgi:hypothetical protein
MIKGKEGNLLSRLKFKITLWGRVGVYPGEAGYITSIKYIGVG